MHVLTHMFDTGSEELAAFIAEHQTGFKMQSHDGGKVWTVIKLETDIDVPPNPHSGRATTKVTLTLD